MENPITSKCCNNQPWFVLLLFSVFCIELLCFDFSGLTARKTGVTVLNNNNNHGNLISAQNSLSHDFNDTSNDSPLKVETEVDSCLGRYIFVHDLPSRFNKDLINNCELITRGTDKSMCPYLDNLGFGPEIENPEVNVLMNNSWFLTNQFMLEVIFHNKMKSYECLTNDSSIASAVFVPFYAGLDMSLYLWGFNITVRDFASLSLVKWLSEKPEWKRMWGRDHFLVAGRIAWDFRRQTDNESDWGSKLRFLPESKNMSMLSVESSSWNNDYAIPYPTCFHPSKDSEIFGWQDRMRRRNRRYLFSFAGAPRPEYQNSIRGKIIDQCLASKNQCKLLDCNYGATNCDNPINVMRVFQSSIFCLQPPGDSYTRRSIFDSILAGCIPVFFHPGTAYAQYTWHLPKNYTKYSVYIPVKDLSEWKINLNETLLAISEDRILALREEVIRLIPRIVYAGPRSRLETLEDAFDIAIKGILERIESVRIIQFTSKMEGMVTDLTLARENQASFEDYLRSNSADHPGIDLTVTVLTTGFWPSYKSFDLNLPAEMVKCVEVFKGFYETKTKHRKLTWIYSLGTCHINGKFQQKTIELIVSTYQAAVLLLFNASDRLSYSEIMAQLNLTHDDLVRLLHSLSCAKYKILSKEPNTKTISQSDYFEFNSKFSDKLRRIKVPLPPVDERKKVVEDVDKDRRYAIDAAIVRIMKSRKVLGHQQLVSECVEQLSCMFKPDIKAIKKRMEDLITRDYLERDMENPNMFRYLA